LTCDGLTIASSESLTHAALYAIDPTIQSVVHVHHHESWISGLHQLPTTPADIAYGTPEMAKSLQQCYYRHKNTSNIICMAGHEDGIISFGESTQVAVEAVISLLKIIHHN
jgi:ribulose-5-phosphate 4-epimerase/fuculose-1-phosphate aldolase